MGINIGHVVVGSVVLALCSFAYVVGFEPMDEEKNPRAAALNQTPNRGAMINSIRRSIAQGQLEGADEMADQLFEHNPHDPSAYFWRATVDQKIGDTESALANWTGLERVLGDLGSSPSRSRDTQLDYYRGWSKLGIGELGESQGYFRKIADELEAGSDLESGRPSRNRGVHYNLACYRAMSGETGLALEHWKLAVESGYGDNSGWWSVDPDLESLHSEDAFWAIGGEIHQRERDNPDDSEG